MLFVLIIMSYKEIDRPKNKIDQIKETAENILKKDLHNPKSYKFISLNDDFENFELLRYNESKKLKLDIISIIKLYIERNKFIENEYNFGPSDIILSFKCRATNPYNALVKNEYLVICNKDSSFVRLSNL